MTLDRIIFLIILFIIIIVYYLELYACTCICKIDISPTYQDDVVIHPKSCVSVPVNTNILGGISKQID